MADGGKVLIHIDGESKGFQSAMNETGNAAGAAANKISSIFKGIAVGAILKKSLDVAVAGFKAVVDVGSDFESQMSTVKAISGATADEMVQLTNKAKQMGIESAFSATESGKALEYMAMAGWKTKDMLNGIEGVMNLAAASGEDLASVSDIVTDSMTAFGLAADQSGRFADVLAAASSNANTNVALMGETFKYVAPVAGSLGYSIEDTAVAIGLMANAGIKGSQAGTALRGLFTRLVKPTKESGQAMDNLGISITTAEGKIKPLNTLLQEMREKFSTLTDAEKAEYAALLAGQEGMSGLLAIINASDEDFNTLTEAINNSSGAAQEMADIKLDNLQGQIQLLKSSFEGLGIAIYEKFGEKLKEAVKLITDQINILTDAINSGSGEEIVNAITTITENIMKALSDAITEISNFVSENADNITQSISKMIQNIAAELPKLIESYAGALQSLTESLWNQLPELLPSLLESIGASIISFFETMDYVTLGITIVANIAAAIVNALPVVLEALLDLKDTIENKSAPDADKVSAIFQKAFSKVDLSNVGQRLAIDILDAFLAVVQKMAPSPVQSLIQIMRNELGIQRQTLIAEAQMAGVDMVQVMEDSASNMGNVGAEGGSLYTQSMAGAMASGSGILSTAASQMLIGAKAAGESEAANGGTAVGEKFDTNAGTAIASGSGEVSDEAKNVITEAKSAADSEASNFSSVGAGIISGIINGITGGKFKLITTVANLLASAVKAAKKEIESHSPSKVFRDQVGKWIPLGIAVGIEKYQDSVIDAIKNLTTDTRTEVQKVLDDMNEEMLESEKAYQDELKRIEEEEYQEKLKAAKSQEEKQKIINERAQKEKLELLKDTAEKERKIYDANQKDIENSQKSIMNSIQNLAETAIDSLEKVEDKQKDFRGKLRDFGDLVGMATFTSGDKEIEFPIVGDYSQINTMLENYLDIMEKLKARGDLPQEFFDQFLDMDVGEATTKAQAFVNMSDEAFNTYMDNYKKSLSLTDKISKVLYADQVEEAKQEVIDAFGQFNEDMEEQGGKNAKAWTDGFIEKFREIMPNVINSIGIHLANLLPYGAYAYEAAIAEMRTYITNYNFQPPKYASVQEQQWEAEHASWLNKQRGY